jgi:hypothetical protein
MTYLPLQKYGKIIIPGNPSDRVYYGCIVETGATTKLYVKDWRDYTEQNKTPYKIIHTQQKITIEVEE